MLGQLTSVVGRPSLPPYWSLGLMNSKCAAPPNLDLTLNLLGATPAAVLGQLTSVVGRTSLPPYWSLG